MPSFRDRLIMLAMDEQNVPTTSLFRDAASICNTKEAAMAFGYLMGQEDAKKEAPSEPSIYEQVLSTVDQCCDGEYDPEYAADLVFGLIYKWLDKVFEDKGCDPHKFNDESARHVLAEAFQPLVKPGVISPPLPEKEEP
jgi:hypothetical protein